MGGHALRGAVTAWLALIALQAVSSSKSGQVSGALSTVASLVTRALSPDVAAIPDRRKTVKPASQPGPSTPASARAGAKAGAAEPGVAAVLGPNGSLNHVSSLNQYVNGGGLPAGLLDNPALRLP
jgi:hypothetical protein